MLSWDSSPGSTGYDLRIDDKTDPWTPHTPSPNDKIINGLTSISYIFPTIGGHQYDWWLNSNNESGSSSAAGFGSLVSACIGSGVGLPPQPQNLSVSLAGDIATLTWGPSHGATAYDIRIDDLSDPWNPSGSALDSIINGKTSNSHIFKILPGHVYNWWVHATNGAGQSNPTGGTSFGYTGP